MRLIWLRVHPFKLGIHLSKIYSFHPQCSNQLGNQFPVKFTVIVFSIKIALNLVSRSPVRIDDLIANQVPDAMIRNKWPFSFHGLLFPPHEAVGLHRCRNHSHACPTFIEDINISYCRRNFLSIYKQYPSVFSFLNLLLLGNLFKFNDASRSHAELKTIA